MSLSGGGKPSLRAAVAAVHRDPRWWLKLLIYGASALSLVGLPLAAGFILESLDNSRKGFPTPLPLWGDWSLRSLAGLFALLIDFTFFVLPLLTGGLIMICTSVGLIAADVDNSVVASRVLLIIGGLGLAVNLFLFIVSVSPAGRLRFVAEGRIEEALSLDVLRWTMHPAVRMLFLQARLISLPAYLPSLVLGAITFSLSQIVFAGQLAAVLVMVWLTLGALIYAHLIVVQVYVAAERELQRRLMA